MKIAGTITAVTQQMRLTRRAAEIALAVAMHESALDPNAVNGPWVGLFQQAVDPSHLSAPTYLRLDTQTPGTYHLDWCEDWAGPQPKDGTLHRDLTVIVPAARCNRELRSLMERAKAEGLDEDDILALFAVVRAAPVPRPRDRSWPCSTEPTYLSEPE